jgi:hypothetical protein
MDIRQHARDNFRFSYMGMDTRYRLYRWQTIHNAVKVQNIRRLVPFLSVTTREYRPPMKAQVKSEKFDMYPLVVTY